MLNNRRRVAANPNVQAVVFAVVALNVQFGQIIFAQKFCKRLDKSYVAIVGGVFSHIILGPLPKYLSSDIFVSMGLQDL